MRYRGKFLSLLGLGFFVGTAILTAQPASAAVKYIRAEGSQIVEVPSGKVRSTCEFKFLYRDVNKDDVEPYLQKQILKAAFTGNLIPQLDLVVEKLQRARGFCSWVSPQEFGKW